MNKDRLARGYTPSVVKDKGSTLHYGKGKGKSLPTAYKGKSKDSRGKGSGGKSRLQTLISRTKCNLCGQVGHWQQSCPMQQQGTASLSSSTRPLAAFFICHDEAELSRNRANKMAAEMEKKGERHAEHALTLCLFYRDPQVRLALVHRFYC
eukprot:5159335-Amphidinium_carterae.5